MITRIEFLNCGPFRGTHRIELGEGAYAFVAVHEDDPKKSNGVGKSFVLEMVDLAMTGKLSKSREGGADSWITRGEKEARVRLTFDCGAVVTRSKKRGQSTQIRFTRPGAREASQDDAARDILRYFAMSADDFRNAAYFEQRKMARLIDPEQTSPGDRLGIISGWFGLGLADRAEARAAEIASSHEKELTKLVARRDALRTVAEGMSVPDDAEIANLAAQQIAAEEDVRRLEEEGREMKRRETARDVVAAQASLLERAKKLRAEVEAIGDVEGKAADAEDLIAGAASARSRAATDVQAKRRVALGMFDGKCPVAPIDCPAKKRINDDREQSASALKDAEGSLKELDKTINDLRLRYQPLFDQRRDLQVKQKRLEELREEARANADDVKRARRVLEELGDEEADAFEHDAQLNAARALVRDLAAKVGAAKGARKQRDDANAQREAVEREVAARQLEVRRFLKAAAIFRTAQRRVAERNLSFVEGEANYQLADVGIDLQVAARWEREAGGPAKTCEECGASFPSSAKVKTCERCAAPRGVHTVQRLDIIPSDRSGALADLAGVMLQLSAGSWLLGARNSPWSTAMLDEPFAACDAFNRRALATQLVKLVTRGAWRQSLIISHSPDTVDVYPHKIVIVRSADGARRIEQR